jgi:hypothetical protein
VVQYYVQGDFWLILVSLQLISMKMMINKACVSSTPIKASGELSLIFLDVVKANYKVHEICYFTSCTLRDFHAIIYKIDGPINIVFIKVYSIL